ncbi:dynein light chain binding, partial [Trichomonas vaginalis G3]
MGAILDLLADIIDPERINVKINEIDKSQKVFPDLGYLTEVARKMKIIKAERSEEVQQETFDFCEFIRIADYFILENLHKLCLNCWKQAETYVLQSLSSIFQVEVSYDANGKVIFTPSLNELLGVIRQALDQSILILDGLPRIIGSSKFRPHLMKKYGNLQAYFDKCPTFKQYTDCNKQFSIIKNSILNSVKESYISSNEHSRGFENFYDIFVRGKEWSPKSYIKLRGGDNVVFDLMKFASDYDRKAAQINYNPSEELIVDFRVIRDDIEKFRQEDVRINEFTTCTVQGSIYINSKNLRQCLTPIPARSMQQIKECLKELFTNKIEHMGAIFRFCSKRLKKEPESLIQYVDNCEFNELMEKLSKYLHIETTFVEELSHLLDTLEFHGTRGAHGRSPLGALLKQFVYDQTNANSVADQMRNTYTLQLSNKIKTAQAKILDFDERLHKSPPEIKYVMLPDDANHAQELLNEINSLETEIALLNRSQNIMKAFLADLSDFYKVRDEIKQLLVAYEAVSKWHEIDNIITTVPFNSINIMEFNKKVTDLNDIIMNLKTSLPLPLVDDLTVKIDSIVPYLEVLETLANSKMNYNHWNILFEQCGHPKGYFQQIKIDELMHQGILSQTAKIEEITATAQGENQLEQEYKVLLQHWKEVKMPIDETQTKTDDNLMIGDIKDILKEIEGGKNTVQTMLSGQYVQGLKQNVLALGATLDTFSNVLIAWKAFQENWIVLNVFFSKKDTAQALQSLSSQFIGVRRRWMSLVRHAADNLTLFHICEFPSILEMLRENNEFLINIMKGVLKFIDHKRYIFPRLFFLSNHEVM